MTRPITHLTQGTASAVAMGRMDLAIVIEKGEDFPIMFHNKAALLAYMGKCGMEQITLENISPDHAILFKTPRSGNPGNYLETLWVQAKWSGYRTAFKAKHSQSNYRATPSSLHADHLINRGSLKLLSTSNGNDPWVMLFEVPRGANTGVGAAIEAKLPQFPITQTDCYLEPLQAFKVFATDWPKTISEFNVVMKSIAGQLLDTAYVARIRDAVLNVYTFPPP